MLRDVLQQVDVLLGRYEWVHQAQWYDEHMAGHLAFELRS